MLQKPGEARQKAAAPRNRRRVVEEDLEDVIRRLQRLPPNKSCADCSSKLTQCVNLTHGTFVCMACSGVHRGFNHKIKGIGHSSFTPDEVARLRHPDAGNEAVNAKYLANYDPRRERLKPPHDNNDLQLLRAWIQRKYIDKSWLDKSKVESTEARKPAAPPKSAAGPSRPASSKSQSSKRSSLPKVGSPTSPPEDLFGFDSFPPASAPAPDASWDAFGGSASNQTATQSTRQPATFQSDFGGMNNVPPVSPAPPPAPAFQADFGNFSQPTMVSLPPAGQLAINQQTVQQQQPFQTNFGPTPVGNHTQSPQQSFRANFDEAAINNQPQQQNQQPYQANSNNNSTQLQNTESPVMQGNNDMSFGQFPQQQNNMQSGFANFGSVQNQQGQMPQQQQQNQIQPHQSEFADFGSMQAGQVPKLHVPQNNGQSGYGNLGPAQHQQTQLPLQQQQQQNQMQPQQSTFADFGSLPAGQGTTLPEENYEAPSGFGSFGSVQQQRGQVPEQLQQTQMQSQQSAFADFSSVQSGQGIGSQTMPTQEMTTTGRGGVSNVSIHQQPDHQNGQIGLANIRLANEQNGQESGAVMAQQQSFGSNNDNASFVSNTKQIETIQSSGAAPSRGTMNDSKPVEENGASDQQSKMSVNLNAFRSSDDKKDAFDAFDGLSLEPFTGFTDSSAASIENSAASTTRAATPAKFKEGQRVIYTNQVGSCPVDVLKVHHDDKLHPYYTISLNRREKQTEESRLSTLDEHLQVDSAGSLATSVHSAPNHVEDSSSAKLQQTIAMLQDLNGQQLSQVQQFIATLSAGQAHGMQSLRMTQKGDVNTAMGTENTRVQNESSGMYHYQRGQMNNMFVPGSVVQNGIHPQTQQNQYGSVNQHPMGMSMGMGINNGIGMGSASMDSSIHSGPMGGAPAMGTPMGGAAPAAPAPVAPPPALPPVEKEGNPFDMY
eukprot:CAMPEP_0171336666 /NCGR_PEP_ID=MMETSP0878-20121228/6177_1 /TAXON_ID=67004 /ORGANISM="Thalassiosira weissflogii, Strain CCMP1336" /LENGTH=940 /DNA_ID=CAMNT_0011838167 /DNA_START=115 /DNA_END=2937 /DNA_ORIENTATION=-